jgi:hypothetical protein
MQIINKLATQKIYRIITLVSFLRRRITLVFKNFATLRSGIRTVDALLTFGTA